MWYFAWVLGTIFACILGIVTALVIEYLESTETLKDKKTDKKQKSQ